MSEEGVRLSLEFTSFSCYGLKTEDVKPKTKGPIEVVVTEVIKEKPNKQVYGPDTKWKWKRPNETKNKGGTFTVKIRYNRPAKGKWKDYHLAWWTLRSPPKQGTNNASIGKFDVKSGGDITIRVHLAKNEFCVTGLVWEDSKKPVGLLTKQERRLGGAKVVVVTSQSGKIDETTRRSSGKFSGVEFNYGGTQKGTRIIFPALVGRNWNTFTITVTKAGYHLTKKLFKNNWYDRYDDSDIDPSTKELQVYGGHIITPTQEVILTSGKYARMGTWYKIDAGMVKDTNSTTTTTPGPSTTPTATTTPAATSTTTTPASTSTTTTPAATSTSTTPITTTPATTTTTSTTPNPTTTTTTSTTEKPTLPITTPLGSV